MEENQKKQKSNGKTLFTVALSLFVAIAAIVSLVGVGFNQVSYAAETTGDDTTSGGLSQFTFKQKYNSDGTNYYVNLMDEDSTFKVPIYYRQEDNKPVFCVQHDIDPGVNGLYNKLNKNETDLSEEEMQGVLYILRQSKSAYDSAPGISGKTGTIEDVATQVAIWAYLYDKTGGRNPNSLVLGSGAGGSDICNSGAQCRDVIRNFGAYEDTTLPSSSVEVVPGLNLKINKVVNDALAYRGASNNITVKKENSNITKTSDNKFYQSSKLTVTATEHITKYNVEVSGIAGAVAVNDNGDAKSEFSPGEVFYVRVPVDKVTDKKQTINIKVTGTFDGKLIGTYFGISGKQTVVTVTETTTTEDASESIDFVKAPDTAMSSVQTIYFIGLVVLLCGIGIIYANAKPVEEK